MADSTKSTFENINDLVKAIAWPSLILLAFLGYRTEFNRIIELIPDKLESSSKISIGSLSFEIEKTAKASGNAQLGKIIKNLSEPEIIKLLTLGGESNQQVVSIGHMDDGSTNYESPFDINVILSLENRGLLKASKSVHEFIYFIKSLHPSEVTLYKRKNGEYSTEKEKDSVPFVQYSIPVSSLSIKDRERLEGFTIELSESGKKAFSIIVHATAEQIKEK